MSSLTTIGSELKEYSLFLVRETEILEVSDAGWYYFTLFANIQDMQDAKLQEEQRNIEGEDGVSRMQDCDFGGEACWLFMDAQR